MFDTIGLGDRVTVRTPQGEQTGRAVIHKFGIRLWVLDMDGKPWLATPDSLVKVEKAKPLPAIPDPGRQ